ncbi:MAG: hypothetical protein NTV06_02270 [candidate division Zixibacteria bacterium]|nr:hypothetical protein [candidate division Zixibacteria bacterium]
MKKLVILTLAIFLIAFTTGYTTMTRALTMGDANNIIHDGTNISLYPALIVDYPGLVIAEFDTCFTKVGVHYKFGDENPHVLGMYFKNQPVDKTGNDRMDLYYGHMLGENKFGVHINYVNGSYKEEAAADKYEQSITDYGIDLGLGMMQGKLDFAAAFEFLTWKNIDTLGYDSTKPKGNIAIDIRGRYFYELDPKMTLVPHLGLTMVKVGVEFYPGTAPNTLLYTEKITTMIIDGGLGLNYVPSTDMLVIGDIGLKMQSSKDKITPPSPGTAVEDKSSVTAIPYFRVGLDAAVFNWMNLRVGGTSFWNAEKDEPGAPGATKKHWGYVANTLYLGAGFHWNNLFLDAQVNPDLITNGLNFISGNTTAPMNMLVSLKYNLL